MPGTVRDIRTPLSTVATRAMYGICAAAVSVATPALAQAQTPPAETSPVASPYSADGGGASYLASEAGLELRQITANGIGMSVATGGNTDGPVLLLVHGFLGNAYSWSKVATQLSENYLIVVPDMRGYGGSEITDEGYDGQTLASDFAALMETLGHSEYHIMAHDMGAPPALLLAARHSERVRTLTYLEEPAMLPDNIADKIEMTREDTTVGGLWWWMTAQSPSMTETLVLGNELDFISWFYDNYSAVDGAVTDRARQIFAADLASPRDIHGWFGVYRDVFETMDQTAALENNRVSTPILAVGGENSQGTDIGDNLQRVASNVTTRSLANSTHFLMDEQPEALLEMFESFVAAQSE